MTEPLSQIATAVQSPVVSPGADAPTAGTGEATVPPFRRRLAHHLPLAEWAFAAGWLALIALVLWSVTR